MKPQSINLIEKHGLTYVKTQNSKVFCPQELSTRLFNKLMPEMDRLEYAAKITGKPIYFYPLSKNNSLMNFGPYTSVISNDIASKDLTELLRSAVNRTYKACNINK